MFISCFLKKHLVDVKAITMDMPDAYWFGTELRNFLFHGYNIISAWGLLSTCIGLSALAILYEAMKLSQIHLHEISKKHGHLLNPVQSTDSSSLISRVSERSAGIFNSLKCFLYARWFVEVFHWSIHVTLGYFLMLTVMTFNGYLSIALILGSGIGYYIFGPILHESNMKKLQKRRRLMECNPECADAITSDRRESTMSTISENSDIEVNINVDIDVHVKNETA